MAAQKAQLPVTLIDNSQAALDKGLGFADKLLDKDVSKQRISKEDAASARTRLTPSTKMDDLSDVDFVIEAVPVGHLRISESTTGTENIVGNPGAQDTNIRSAASALCTTCHSRHEHVVDLHHQNCCRDRERS